MAAVTGLYEFYHDVVRSGQYQFVIMDLHKRYGPIVRISPVELHISDPDFYDELYANPKDPRDKWTWAYDITGAPTGFFSAAAHERH